MNNSQKKVDFSTVLIFMMAMVFVLGIFAPVTAISAAEEETITVYVQTDIENPRLRAWKETAGGQIGNTTNWVGPLMESVGDGWYSLEVLAVYEHFMVHGTSGSDINLSDYSGKSRVVEDLWISAKKDTGSAVFKTDLKKVIDTSAVLNKLLFTSESWDVVVDALASAKSVFNNLSSNQAAVDQQENLLSKAILSLVRVDSGNDGTSPIPAGAIRLYIQTDFEDPRLSDIKIVKETGNVVEIGWQGISMKPYKDGWYTLDISNQYDNFSLYEYVDGKQTGNTRYFNISEEKLLSVGAIWLSTGDGSVASNNEIRKTNLKNTINLTTHLNKGDFDQTKWEIGRAHV